MADTPELEAAQQAAERFLASQCRADRERSHAVFDADFLEGSGLTEGEYLEALDRVLHEHGQCLETTLLGHAHLPGGDWRFLWRARCEKGDGVIVLTLTQEQGRFYLTESYYL
jgi:hypothetical protein